MMSGKGNMDTRCEIVVRPIGTGRETRLVLLAALVTLAVCALIVGFRNTTATAKVVPAWQVDAFKDLRTEELATFNALYTAVPEIEAMHGDRVNHWPTVAELESNYIPPFVPDTAWRKRGSLDWARSVVSTCESHVALYLGRPDDASVSGSFLLVMMHDHVKKQGNAGGVSHAPYEIWINSSQVVEFPQILTDQALINSGWREVVARKGEDEMKRTKGEDFLQ